MYTSCLVTSSPPPQFLYWPQTVVAETRSVPQSIFPTHSHEDQSTYHSDTRLNKEQATGLSESLTMSRCPVLYTSNKDFLFQEARRIHCQKDRQGINLDIWKINLKSSCLQNMGPYCCRVQSPQQHLPFSKVQATRRRIQHCTNWSHVDACGHPPFNPTGANF